MEQLVYIYYAAYAAKLTAVSVFVLGVIWMVIKFVKGSASRDSERNAVSAGAGEYRADPKTGEVRFHWLNSKTSDSEDQRP